jgi:crotonobetainyl-CoA:carnitine CoA-transferase CaiB-like acyl-CoA transferase
MAGPLDGVIRIIDLSERSPAAAIAGMVLADLGAEVIRVEPEDGDPVRMLEGSRVWFRGQKSVTLGPKQARSREWQSLRDSADVILNTAQPWIHKPHDLLDSLRGDRNQILAVLTAYPRHVQELSPVPEGSNYPVYGELIEAQYGMQHFQQGVRQQPPTFLGWPHAIYGAAWLLQIGILGALLERERTGAGQTVTTSLLDGIAILSNARWLGGDRLGPALLTSSRITTRHSNLRIVVSLFECSDGNWIQVHTGPRGAFDRLLKVVARQDLLVENAGLHVLGIAMDPVVAKDLWDHLDRTFKSESAQYWCDTLAQADVCCMPALKPGDSLWLKQMEENGLVDILPDGRRQLGKLAKYSRTPIELRRELPVPGQHNPVLLQSQELDGSGANGDGTIARHLDAGGAPSTMRARDGQSAMRIGPLDGMLVLDFGAYMAGPFANRIFADLGARVIKVEEYGGDPMRGPQLGIFLGVQRGKQSLAVDLKSEEGRAIVHQLVARADVVHNNMRLGAMDRLGMGWEQLRAINPRLVYCHSSGYGNRGEWSRLPTFEPLHSAITGMLSRTGGEGNPPDHYLTHMDYGCGLTSAVMVLAALIERERSGLGQFLEVPQTGAGLLAMSDVHGHKERTSETFPLDRQQRGHAATNALYRTSDGWIVIACYSEREWNALRRALDIEGSEWPRFPDARNQPLSQSTAAGSIEAALGTINTAAAIRRLRAEGVPCAVPAPFEPAAIINEPTLRSRGIIVAEQHYEAGEVFEVGHTIRFNNSNAWNLRPAPVTGQHSIEILRELGKSDAEISGLIAAKIVNVPGVPSSAVAGSEQSASGIVRTGG